MHWWLFDILQSIVWAIAPRTMKRRDVEVVRVRSGVRV